MVMFFMIFSFCVGYTPMFSCVCLAHHHDKSICFPLQHHHIIAKLQQSFENSYFQYFLKNNLRKAVGRGKNYAFEHFSRAEWYEVYLYTDCKINAKTTENISQKSTQISSKIHPSTPNLPSTKPTYLQPQYSLLPHVPHSSPSPVPDLTLQLQKHHPNASFYIYSHFSTPKTTDKTQPFSYFST
jgi:hypothetical protein